MNVFQCNHVPQMNRDPRGIICVVQRKEPRKNLSEGIYVQFKVSLSCSFHLDQHCQFQMQNKQPELEMRI